MFQKLPCQDVNRNVFLCRLRGRFAPRLVYFLLPTSPFFRLPSLIFLSNKMQQQQTHTHTHTHTHTQTHTHTHTQTHTHTHAHTHTHTHTLTHTHTHTHTGECRD